MCLGAQDPQLARLACCWSCDSAVPASAVVVPPSTSRSRAMPPERPLAQASPAQSTLGAAEQPIRPRGLAAEPTLQPERGLYIATGAADTGSGCY